MFDKPYFRYKKIISAASRIPIIDIPKPIPNWAGTPGEGPPKRNNISIDCYIMSLN